MPWPVPVMATRPALPWAASIAGSPDERLMVRDWPAPLPEMKRIVPADIVLGEPLAFSIFDQNGHLLLRKGVVVTMADQVDRLIARGALMPCIPARAAAPAAARSPVAAPGERQAAYDRMGALVLNLKHVIATAQKAPEQIDLPTRIAKIAQTIQQLCSEDVDSVLAAPYLDFQNPYLIVHQVMGAVLTELIAARKGLAAAARLPLVCAAITRDWGQLSLQGELERCDGPLPDALRERGQRHPAVGAAMLGQAGVDDAVWLDAVGSHHERLNGSGYPQGLAGAAIGLGGRILAIADIYAAMTKPRPYRAKAHFPQNALREIYLKSGSELDGELTNLLVRELGLFPPGSIVRLKCGEIAIVKSAAAKAEQVKAFSIYDDAGMVLVDPVLRDTSQPQFEIAGMVPFSECRTASIIIKRVWLKEAP